MSELTWTWNIYFWPYLLTSLIVGVVVARWWHERGTPWVSHLLNLGIVASLWCLLSAVETAIGPESAKIVVAKLHYIPIPLVPIFTFRFVLAYIDHRLQQDYRLNWLYAIPVLVLLFVVPYPTTTLFWSDHTLNETGISLAFSRGPLFWIWVAFGYGLLIGSIILLVRVAGRVSNYFRRQTDVILVALFIPWIANVAFITGWNPFGDLDLSPIAFATTFLVLHWGTLFYGLLELNPIDRASLMENLLEGIIVIQGNGKVVDVNMVAANMLHLTPEDILGQNFTSILPPNANSLREAFENGPGNYEIDMSSEDEPLHVRVRISHLSHEDNSADKTTLKTGGKPCGNNT